MAKVDGISRYTCDRCGRTQYLSAGDPALSSWMNIHRVTADGVDAQRLLCSDCYTAWRTLAARHDVEFSTFMLNKPQDDTDKKEEDN